MSPKVLIILIVSLVSALVVTFVLLYFLVFRVLSFKKKVREIDKRFQYCHALLIGQDAQYVRRLEIISRTNLLYVDTHTGFLRKFKDIRDKTDVNVQSAVNNLKDLLDEKDFKTLKNNLLPTQELVETYERDVNSFNESLLKVVKPEEDCRQSALTFKEQLRMIKQDYFSKEGELSLMSSTFEEIFEYIDSQFGEFDSFVESAQYDDANSVLSKIDGIMHELLSKMQNLPVLCTLISSVIPEKIAEVESTYKLLLEERYPLHHLCVTQTLEDMKGQLEVFTHNVRTLEIDGVYEKLQGMIDKLSSFFDEFDIEKGAKLKFDEKNEQVYSTVNTIERRFIKLRNIIPEVANIFIINQSHAEKMNEIQKDINRVGALKRSLDTYIHSNSKQPYSLLVSKIEELEEASSIIITEIDEFSRYLSSLKGDAERAYEVVSSFYDKVKKAEQQVRTMNVQKVTEKYNSNFARIYELLNDINLILVTRPIDVDKVNDLVHELHDLTNILLDDGEVFQDYNNMLLAENSIMYANKHRPHLADIDEILKQAEGFFEIGDFEKASLLAGDAINKIKQNNGR